MKTVLTIAGLDPSGGAGVSADLATFAAFKLSGLSAVTALTDQDGKTVRGVLPTPPPFLFKQLTTLLSAYDVDAVKIGMLVDAEIVATVEKVIKLRSLDKIVLDPVMSSSDGYPLLEKSAVGALKILSALATVVTPNIDEAALLSGIKLTDTKGMEEAAKRIHALGARYVLVTGGHLEGDPVDVLFDGEGFDYVKGRRVKTRDLHGTGCALSSAIAAGLALGNGVKRSVRDARVHVANVLKARR